MNYQAAVWNLCVVLLVLLIIGGLIYLAGRKLRYIKPCPHGYISEERCPMCRAMKGRG